MSSLHDDLERFRQQPDDASGFAKLEEALFVSGAWQALVGLYEARLGAAAVATAPAERARLLVRQGRVCADHLADAARAEACFRSALASDARNRPALGALRRLCAARAQWDVALQIAELELTLEMPADERAPLLCEVGELWLAQLRDADLALRHFREALVARPQHGAAHAGCARAFEALGRTAEAADAWERAASALRGPARADALATRARLLHGMGERERAGELCRRALTEDARCGAALALLAELAADAGQWPLCADLLERRFELAGEAGARGEVALRLARLHLEHLGGATAARLWLARAAEFLPRSAELHAIFGELEREAGNEGALRRHLARQVELADPPPVAALTELAALLVDAGEPGAAVAHLERALAQAPEDALVVDALCDAFALLGRHAELADCLERRAALVRSDPGLRAGLLVELGALYETRLEDPDAARGAYERALDADPEAPGLVERIAQLCRKTEAWDALRRTLERATSLGATPQRVASWCALGELLAERFDDPSGAGGAFDAALALDPAAERAHRGRQALAEARGDAEGVLAAYEREAAVASDRGRLGFLVGEIALRLDAAGRLAAAPPWIERWVRACPEEIAPLELAARTAHALGSPDEELQALERLDPLVRGAERAACRRRIAELHSAAGRGALAIEASRAAIAAWPDDRDAHELLVRELERAHRVEDAIAARRALVALLPEAELAAGLDALARLQAGRGGDLGGAIESLVRLAELAGAPDDVEARLEDLFDRSRRFEEHAERLERRLAALRPGDPSATELALRRARLLLEPLARPAEAADAFEALAREGCAEAQPGLERALRASGDVARLAAFLGAQAASHPDPAQRERAEFERAGILEDLAAQPAEAAALYRRLCEGAADASLREAAAERLERLLEREREWPALRAHWEARLSAAAGPARAALHEALAKLCRDRVSDPDAATAHFEAAAALAPERADLWQALARLHEEADRPAELARALEAELAAQPAPERERALRGRIAHLAATALGEPERAGRHYARLLELDPGDAAASEFLVAHFEASGRAAELVGVLEGRLAALVAAPPDAAATGARTALRLRIAGLRATRLRDAEGAIAMLEPALAEHGALGAVAEPLADLYQRSGRHEALEALCRAAAERAAEGAERAGWLVRLGDALRARGADREAVATYRDAVTENPAERDAQAALRELYRRLDEPAPLARLLEAELAHRAGPREVSLRLELSRLLGERLGRPEDALLHLRRVLQIDPGCSEALERALALAEGDARGEILRGLLDESLARPLPDTTRARLLAVRARLLAEELGRDRDAAADLRESLALDPTRAEARALLREELARLEDWEGVLDALRGEALAAPPGRRAALCEEAIEIAWQRVGADAALPWLERLRCEEPRRAEVPARIAEAHRLAGRTEARLRALEDELALRTRPADRRRLALECAGVLERELGSPARAAAALAAARREAADDPEILAALDRLLAGLGRHRERAEVLEARLAAAPRELAARLLAELAQLWSGPLGDPARAAPLWQRAVDATSEPGVARAERLRALGACLRTTAPRETWARCAEAELESLDASDPVFAERRAALHAELVDVYRATGRPEAALRHLRPLVDAPAAPGTRSRERAEALVALLRDAGAWLELEERLAAQVALWPTAEGWLELARLREERLHAPAKAVLAYRRSLELAPHSLDALRGLRAAAERAREWPLVAEALELELEASPDAPPAARAGLLRTLGDVAWHRLEATTRASRCYAAALEADPEDFASLRALEELLEAMEDWRGAVGLYESEVEALGAREPERRTAAWLRAGELARDHLGDLARARHAYLEAAAIAALPHARLAELAELQHRSGDLAGFVASLGAWCDDPASGARDTDRLRLASALEELDRPAEALARAQDALARGPGDAAAFDLAARLHERCGDAGGAVAALERAAALATDGEGAARLVRAAELCAEPERAAGLLRAAAARDPGSAAVLARLARAEERRGALEPAETAAARALALAAAPDLLDADERCALARLGGRCARARGRLEAAARFFAEALRYAPGDPDALAGSGEVLCELGDLAGAREALERRLAPGDAYAERAAHLTLLAACLDAAGASDEALARCEEALALDPARDAAHALAVRLHEGGGRVDAGIAALERWAEVAPDAARRGERLLRAAEWERRSAGREADAERHYRAVIAALPRSPEAWQGLAWLLWHRGDVEEALQTANAALALGADEASRAPLALLRARALERQGAHADAAEAYALAAAADPRCLEAGLARARLLRAAGDWRGAAEALRAFVAAHPGDDPAGLAQALHQQGRLLAGPLEDVEGAIAAYERAIELDPGTTGLRPALASLLSYRPERWNEALTQQRAILESDPTHAPTLRAALRVAASRPRGRATGDGLAILRALGIAAASELAEAPVALSGPIAGSAMLDDPLHEKVRLLAQHTARELGDALGHGGAPGPAPDADAGDALAAFRAAAFAAEGRLAAPALLPLSTRELGEVLGLVATLAVESEPIRASGSHVNALSASLGRRSRRALRRLLEGVAPGAVADVDFAAWRSELRALAAAIALDETGAGLRTALVALAAETSEGVAALPENADLSALVAASPEAKSLLRRAIRAWLARL